MGPPVQAARVVKCRAWVWAADSGCLKATWRWVTEELTPAAEVADDQREEEPAGEHPDHSGQEFAHQQHEQGRKQCGRQDYEEQEGHIFAGMDFGRWGIKMPAVGKSGGRQ